MTSRNILNSEDEGSRDSDLRYKIFLYHPPILLRGQVKSHRSTVFVFLNTEMNFTVGFFFLTVSKHYVL